MLWFSTLFIIWNLHPAVTSDESCYQYRRKSNVTIDTDQCSYGNYTEPKTKRFCLDSCFGNDSVRDKTRSRFCSKWRNFHQIRWIRRIGQNDSCMNDGPFEVPREHYVFWRFTDNNEKNFRCTHVTCSLVKVLSYKLIIILLKIHTIRERKFNGSSYGG